MRQEDTAFTMKYRRLGRTGLYVSEICLGAMTFAGQEGSMWGQIGSVDQAGADAMIGRALESGVNFIDTADVYSFGQSERMVGAALKNLGTKRTDVVIATKVYGEMGRGPNDRGASRGHILDGVKASLDRLGLDYIDLFQIHANDPITPVEETLRALDDLVSEGLVRYVGCSNWSAWKMMKAHGIAEARGYARFETVQAYYSIAGRDLEREIVPMMQDQQMGLMVWSPMAGGLLSGKFGRDGAGPNGARRVSFDFPPVNKDRAWDCVDAMRVIADARGVSVAQIALAWVLSRPWVTTVIIGAKTDEQLDDNLAAADITLTDDEIAALDAASKLPPEYPGWMLERQGGNREPKPFVKKD